MWTMFWTAMFCLVAVTVIGFRSNTIPGVTYAVAAFGAAAVLSLFGLIVHFFS